MLVQLLAISEDNPSPVVSSNSRTAPEDDPKERAWHIVYSNARVTWDVCRLVARAHAASGGEGPTDLSHEPPMELSCTVRINACTIVPFATREQRIVPQVVMAVKEHLASPGPFRSSWQPNPE